MYIEIYTYVDVCIYTYVAMYPPKNAEILLWPPQTAKIRILLWNVLISDFIDITCAQ